VRLREVLHSDLLGAMINATVCQGRNCQILRESAGEVTKAGDFCLQLRWETGQAG
jgi:hypothetical protein